MSSLRVKLLIALVLIVALAGCGTTVDEQLAPPTVSNAPTPTIVADTPTTDSTADMKANEVPRIAPRDVRALITAGEDVVIVDTRSARSYEISHIEGAISIPLEEITERHGELPEDHIIVLYCT